MIKYLSPLKWPAHIAATPLTKQQTDSGFSTNMTLNDALRFLDEELSAAGINQATLYTEIEQISSERLRKRLSSRTGVSLYIKYFDREYIITCDKWQRLEHNIYALHLALRNWCNMEKWGVGSIQTLIAGFGSSRATDQIQNSEDINYKRSDDNTALLYEFGLSENSTLDDATAIYHRRAKSFANDEENLVKLNLIMDKIREYFENKETH